MAITAEQLIARLQQMEERLAASQAREEALTVQVNNLAAAAGAATTAAAAGPPPPPPRPSLSPIIDTRVLNKPSSFGGRDEQWVSWSIRTRAYCGALDADLLREMSHYADSPTPVLNSAMAPEAQQRSCTLYYILTMLIEGKAQSKVGLVPAGAGYELWRRLCLEYEPKHMGTRSAGLLVQVLTYQFDSADILASIESWEQLILQYDNSVDSLDALQGPVKVATMLSRLPKGNLQEHLLLNASRFKDYNEMKAEILTIMRTQRHLTPAGGGRNSTGQAPMEIGALNVGRGGAKGDARRRNMTCFKCGEQGHASVDCPKKKGANSVE